MAKGGGSANKTQLLQQTKATLNDKSFEEFVEAQVCLAAAACFPACQPRHSSVTMGVQRPQSQQRL